MLDIFSRMVVGWLLVRRADAPIAGKFIESTIAKHAIAPGQLTVHADRGGEMIAQSVTDSLARLNVRQSHSRPHISDDNPFSESQFKTMKYCATFPNRFGSFEDAQCFVRTFIEYYNNEHRYSGIAMLMPAVVHAGHGAEYLARRHAVKVAAFQRYPDRFVNGAPKRQSLPEMVRINPPSDGLRAA